MKMLLTRTFVFIALMLLASFTIPAKADTGTVKSIADWIANESGHAVQPARAKRIAKAVVFEARKNELDPFLLTAMIKRESGFNSNARSSYGAVGLLQVVPRYHRAKFEGKAPNNVEANIRAGAKVLSEYLQSSNGNLAKALKRYSGNARNYKSKVTATAKEIRRHDVVFRFQNYMSLFSATDSASTSG